MTEEEFFRKNYPDSCYGDKPLSPHWDFFQDGVEFGERKSEERITELEQELADAKKVQIIEHFEAYGQCRDSRRIAELEQENAELKADNDARKFAMAMSEKVEKQLREENAELKEKFLKVKTDDVRKSKLNSYKTFEEKNEYLRQVANYAIFNEDTSVMMWCFVQRGDIYTEQLTKAKELLKQWVELYKPKLEGYPIPPIQEQTEQFLKDLEK